MNLGTLQQKLKMYFIVTKITQLKKKEKKSAYMQHLNSPGTLGRASRLKSIVQAMAILLSNQACSFYSFSSPFTFSISLDWPYTLYLHVSMVPPATC